jgi:hypothetical protein
MESEHLFDDREDFTTAGSSKPSGIMKGASAEMEFQQQAGPLGLEWLAERSVASGSGYARFPDIEHPAAIQ